MAGHPRGLGARTERDQVRAGPRKLKGGKRPGRCVREASRYRAGTADTTRALRLGAGEGTQAGRWARAVPRPAVNDAERAAPTGEHERQKDTRCSRRGGAPRTRSPTDEAMKNARPPP